MCTQNPYGTVRVFLMGPFLLLINWSLVKSVFMKSLWDCVCISYGTLPITHNLIFGQICVHEILMGPCVHFIWDPCCCCLPTPMTLASGGSPMFPLVVHQPAFPSIWPAVPSLRRGLSINPGVTMWCVCGCSWRDDVCRVCGFTEGA